MSREPLFKGLRKLKRYGGDEGPEKSPADEDGGADAGTRTDLESQGTLSDANQTASDADQTASDADQTASDADQAQSEADQHASDLDQAAADRELQMDMADTELSEYRRSRAERLSGTEARDVTTMARLRTASDRDRQADERDATAAQRDLSAHSRDQLAEALDVQAKRSAQALKPPHEDSVRQALAAAEAVRENAATDRARAAKDRERAARDRDRAAREREEASEQLQAAHIDELTGAYRRGMGEVLLRHEIERAQRLDAPLVVAFVDVDQLKAVNDRAGFAAGDDLLQSVAAALSSSLRPYDPLVRMGGDEFVCALSDTKPDDAWSRFEQIKSSIESGSFTVGLAGARPGDTVASLIERSNAEMRRNRDAATH
jgi:diguanylate cyclase (GGDEF)-like protein